MRFTNPQYNCYDSIYRIAGKHFSHNQHKSIAMRMTVATSSTMSPRIHRKGFRTPSKRHPGKGLPGKLHSISKINLGKIAPGKRINPRSHPPHCDNSNDSGFGFDQHVEIQKKSNNQFLQQNQNQSEIDRTLSATRCVSINSGIIDVDNDRQLRTKRQKIENTSSNIQIDNDDACSNDAFIHKIVAISRAPVPVSSLAASTLYTGSKFLSNPRSNVRNALKRPSIPVQNNITTSSKDGSIQLQIISQPEQQHRARYQTEGSRGAVKDRSGNGFPIVKLIGYNKCAVLQVFIGTDIGRVAPHMFYQACKVAGKNSTPCVEKKVDGTMIIEIEFKSENDMTITCDCVGILKERNVDVEHRFPDHSGQRSKKKSTRCRMVFRTQLTHDDGTVETLQVCSYPIICTQPPGVPEICKKSLNSCPVDGGLELFIIGKNFLKDTSVVFHHGSDVSDTNLAGIKNSIWEQIVFPDKEFLQQTHLICTVPPYINQSIIEPVTIQLFVMSSGKRSESHTFVYTPKETQRASEVATSNILHNSTLLSQDTRFTMDTNAPSSVVMWGSNVIEPKQEIDSGMMPPPSTLPLGIARRPSLSNSVNSSCDQLTALGLKTEVIDENSLPETVQTDLFPQVMQNEERSTVAAVVAAAAATTNQRIRKQSIDIIDMHSVSILNDGNFSTTSAAPAARLGVDMNASVVKEEQLNPSLQAQILSVAAVQVVPDQQAVNNSASVNSFIINPSTSNKSNAIFPQPPTISNINMIPTNNTVASSLEQSFSQNILSNNISRKNINEIITMSQNGSPQTVRNSSTNSASVGNIHSSLTQDIILNSEPAASIQSANMKIMQSQSNKNSPSEHITSELILNTTVSPSMMCQSTSDPNNLIVNQVTTANTILNEMNLTPTTTQNTEENMLNNIILSHSQSDNIDTSLRKASNSSNVNVNNNIFLKTAADLINNQERRAISTELNALISLNTNPILNTISSNASQTTSNSSPVLTRNEPASKQQSIQSSQTRLEQVMQPSSSQTVQVNHFNEPPIISGHSMLTNVNTNSLSTIPLANLLITEDVNISSQNGFLHNQIQKTSLLPSPLNQESLLTVCRSSLDKSKIDGGVEQINSSAHSTTANIPQEITTMSDQDLISYINPSCFDQVLN